MCTQYVSLCGFFFQWMLIHVCTSFFHSLSLNEKLRVCVCVCLAKYENEAPIETAQPACFVWLWRHRKPQQPLSGQAGVCFVGACEAIEVISIGRRTVHLDHQGRTAEMITCHCKRCAWGERQRENDRGRGVGEEGEWRWEEEQDSRREAWEKHQEQVLPERQLQTVFSACLPLWWYAGVLKASRPCGRWVACQMRFAIKGLRAFYTAALTYWCDKELIHNSLFPLEWGA